MTTYITDDVLPITITISKELCVLYPALVSAANKLEALFNFHTMTAGWYGDEEQVLNLNLQLEIPSQFLHKQQELKKGTTTLTLYADDVFMETEHNKLVNNIFIALTEGEQQLLTVQKKVLYHLLEIKLRKILNLVAKDKQLLAI